MFHNQAMGKLWITESIVLDS